MRAATGAPPALRPGADSAVGGTRLHDLSPPGWAARPRPDSLSVRAPAAALTDRLSACPPTLSGMDTGQPTTQLDIAVRRVEAEAGRVDPESAVATFNSAS